MVKDIIGTKTIEVKVATEYSCDICKKVILTDNEDKVNNHRIKTIKFYKVYNPYEEKYIDICSKECLHKFIDAYVDGSNDLGDFGYSGLNKGGLVHIVEEAIVCHIKEEG